MDLSNNSDIELISLLKEAKPLANDAFNVIYNKYSSQLFGYCLYKNSNREDAEELFQESWIKFYDSVKSGKTTDNILALLLTISRNLSINKFKHRQTKKFLDIQLMESQILEQYVDSCVFQSGIEKSEFENTVQIAVNCLDEKYKDVIMLYWFGELKFPEIAEICGESESTVRKRFERAMKKMDNILKPYLIQ